MSSAHKFGRDMRTGPVKVAEAVLAGLRARDLAASYARAFLHGDMTRLRAAGVKMHPLDPLTHDEIKAASNAVKAAAADKKLSFLRFNVITLAVCCSPFPSSQTLQVICTVNGYLMFKIWRSSDAVFGPCRSRQRRI